VLAGAALIVFVSMAVACSQQISSALDLQKVEAGFARRNAFSLRCDVAIRLVTFGFGFFDLGLARIHTLQAAFDDRVRFLNVDQENSAQLVNRQKAGRYVMVKRPDRD
jgi:hypothetical protein